MGRKSALTDDQWAEVERRILLEGESVYKLAQEFGVNESSIRRKVKPNKADKAEYGEKTVPELRGIAERKVAADTEAKIVTDMIAALPFGKQQVVLTLAQRLTNISGHMASAAEYGAATAHRLAAIAHAKTQEIDDVNPLDEAGRAALGQISALTKMANEASDIGMNLLKANKDSIDTINAGEPADASITVSFVTPYERTVS